jgi:hypothetical protein
MPSASSTSFSASYDKTTKLISAGIFVLLLLLTIVIPGVFVGCLAALLLVATYAWSPRSYTISERSILVKRLIGAARIRLTASARREPLPRMISGTASERSVTADSSATMASSARRNSAIAPGM